MIKDQEIEILMNEIESLKLIIEERDNRIADLGEDARFLSALYAAGVDSWDGYDDAQRLNDEEDF